MAEKNTIRIGRISSINYPKGTARVVYEDKDRCVTFELPFLAWEYWMPRVKDQVVVAHLSNGTVAGVILGPVWNDGHRPADGREGLYRKEYDAVQGKAVERYDAATGEYALDISGMLGLSSDSGVTIKAGSSTIKVSATGDIVISTGAAVTIKAPTVRLSGSLTVDGWIHQGTEG